MVPSGLSFSTLFVLQTSGLAFFSGRLCPHGDFVAQAYLSLELASTAEREYLYPILTNVPEKTLIFLDQVTCPSLNQPYAKRT